MQTVKMILVGGFLGAGKTTLLTRAARRLRSCGNRVGLITNDQAAGLVDTAILHDAGLPVQEVSGGCFCCRFGDLVAAADRLIASDLPDVLLGEPVGSCTDLSATVLQPLKQHYGERFSMAPFSVVVDVKQVRTLERLRSSLRHAEPARFPADVMYIYQKQLEEADLIVLNKIDLVSGEELVELETAIRGSFPQAEVVRMSARGGIGVDEWLDSVMHGGAPGRTIAEVDYDRYADGEAALGWLNATYRLRMRGEGDWRSLCGAVMTSLQQGFREAAAEIAHLKLHLTSGDGHIVANLTSTEGEPLLRGEAVEATTEALLLMNVRAEIAPAALGPLVERAVRVAVEPVAGATVEDFACFAPGRPQPIYRMGEVV